MSRGQHLFSLGGRGAGRPGGVEKNGDEGVDGGLGEVEGEMEWSSVLSVYRLEGARGEGWNVTSADDDLQCRASSLSRKC